MFEISGRNFNLSQKDVLSTNLNMRIALRILSILQENDRVNKTNLAGKTGLNYNRCVKYLNLLLVLEWIKLILDDTDYFSITEKSRGVLKRLSEV